MGIILVKNNKGGVGKTYITLQLAAHKALIKNKKTLILTSDSQNDVLCNSFINFYARVCLPSIKCQCRKQSGR